MDTSKVVGNLEKLTDKAKLAGAMKDAVDIVRNELATFPPQPDRMRSGNHFNTWVREVGAMPLSAFLQQSYRFSRYGKVKINEKKISALKALQDQGEDVSSLMVNGRLKRKSIKSMKATRPSEMLLEKWKEATVTITVTANEVRGTATNTASYAPYVEGDKQARFHAETPWLTVHGAEQKHLAQIVNQFKKALGIK